MYTKIYCIFNNIILAALQNKIVIPTFEIMWNIQTISLYKPYIIFCTTKNIVILKMIILHFRMVNITKNNHLQKIMYYAHFRIVEMVNNVIVEEG